MTHRPLLAGLVLTQVFFALACTGGASQDGHSAGDDVHLDDTEPPRVDERPDLQEDGRCDWLGSPFATPHDDRVFVLRSTDPYRDCDRNPNAVQKVLFALDGNDRRPLLDLSELTDIRMLGTDAGLILLTEKTETSEHAWRIDPATGDVLQQADLAATIRRTATSPSGRWVALGEDGQVDDALRVQLLDPRELTLHSLSVEGASGGFTWLPDDRLLTAGFLDDGRLRLRIWDLSGTSLPTTPERETIVAGASRTWYEAVLAVSADHQRVAVPAFDGAADVAVVWDLVADEVEIVGQMTGPFVFTEADTLLGYDGDRLRLVPGDRSSWSMSVGYFPEVVVVPHGRFLLMSGGDPGLELLDLDSQEVLSLDASEQIEAYTRRSSEIWLASDQGVRRVDLVAGQQTVFEGSASRRTLWLPSTDELYVDEAQAPTVHILDPESGEVLRSHDLTGNVDATTLTAP